MRIDNKTNTITVPTLDLSIIKEAGEHLMSVQAIHSSGGYELYKASLKLLWNNLKNGEGINLGTFALDWKDIELFFEMVKRFAPDFIDAQRLREDLFSINETMETCGCFNLGRLVNLRDIARAKESLIKKLDGAV